MLVDTQFAWDINLRQFMCPTSKIQTNEITIRVSSEEENLHFTDLVPTVANNNMAAEEGIVTTQVASTPPMTEFVMEGQHGPVDNAVYVHADDILALVLTRKSISQTLNLSATNRTSSSHATFSPKLLSFIRHITDALSRAKTHHDSFQCVKFACQISAHFVCCGPALGHCGNCVDLLLWDTSGICCMALISQDGNDWCSRLAGMVNRVAICFCCCRSGAPHYLPVDNGDRDLLNFNEFRAAVDFAWWVICGQGGQSDGMVNMPSHRRPASDRNTDVPPHPRASGDEEGNAGDNVSIDFDNSSAVSQGS